jgi:hypothetical protein
MTKHRARCSSLLDTLHRHFDVQCLLIKQRDIHTGLELHVNPLQERNNNFPPVLLQEQKYADIINVWINEERRPTTIQGTHFLNVSFLYLRKVRLMILLFCLAACVSPLITFKLIRILFISLHPVEVLIYDITIFNSSVCMQHISCVLQYHFTTCFGWIQPS